MKKGGLGTVIATATEQVMLSDQTNNSMQKRNELDFQSSLIQSMIPIMTEFIETHILS
jgi:hypothetical protein